MRRRSAAVAMRHHAFVQQPDLIAGGFLAQERKDRVHRSGKRRPLQAPGEPGGCLGMLTPGLADTLRVAGEGIMEIFHAATVPVHARKRFAS